MNAERIDVNRQRGKIGRFTSASVLFISIVILALVVLGWSVIKVRANSPPPSLSVTGAPTQLYVISMANIRDRATVKGSNIVGKLAPGEMVEGVVEQGEISGHLWLRLGNGSGFVSIVNLSDVAPNT